MGVPFRLEVASLLLRKYEGLIRDIITLWNVNKTWSCTQYKLESQNQTLMYKKKTKEEHAAQYLPRCLYTALFKHYRSGSRFLVWYNLSI